MKIGEIKTDDSGRIIRIRPSQKRLNQLLSGDYNTYKATHLEYDAKGNIAKIVDSEFCTNGKRQTRNWKHTEDDVVKIDYTYDSYGNWTMSKITTYHQSWLRYLSSYGQETNKKESYYMRDISYYSDNDTTVPISFFNKVGKQEREEEEEVVNNDTIQQNYDDIEKIPTYPVCEYRLNNEIVGELADKNKYEGDGKYHIQTIVKDFQEELEQKKETEAKRQRDAQAEAARICTFAYDAINQYFLIQEYNKLSKLSKGMDDISSFFDTKRKDSKGYTIHNDIKLKQIVKFGFNGDLYTFIKKDKTVIQDIHFNRIVHDLDYLYHDFGFVSEDKRYALITHHNNQTDDFIYLVEFEGNEVKSISGIPYKKSKYFVMPQL